MFGSYCVHLDKSYYFYVFFFELKLQYTRCKDMVRESTEDNLTIVIIMMGDDNHGGKT